MIIDGRHKFGFLTGEVYCPSLGDSQPLRTFWKGEGSLIRAMLINSMEPQIDKPLFYATTSKDIWNTTQKLYSKRQNDSRLYMLRKEVHECK